jgi:hypothetical protein
MHDLPHAALIPSGVVLLTRPFVYSGKPGELREFGGSNARSLSFFGFLIRGRWLVWGDAGPRLNRDDVLAARLTQPPHDVGWDGESASRFDIAEDGTVAFTAFPLSYTGTKDITSGGELFLLRPGGEVEQITSSRDAFSHTPKTDGTNVVYTAQSSRPAPNKFRLVLRTPRARWT